jgi:hypothetical protein
MSEKHATRHGSDNMLSIPSKPPTLDLFFRRACYNQNASYGKMTRIKVEEKL